MKLNIQLFGGRGASSSTITKTLYHGSPNTNIKELDISRSGQNTMSAEYGIFFTDSKKFADDFSYERIETDSMFFDKKGKKGKIYTAKVSIKKPLDLGKVKDFDKLYDYASSMGRLDGKEKFINNMKTWQKIGNHQLMKANLDLRKIAKSKKYDSVVAKLSVQGKEKEYILFSNKNIKNFK